MGFSGIGFGNKNFKNDLKVEINNKNDETTKVEPKVVGVMEMYIDDKKVDEFKVYDGQTVPEGFPIEELLRICKEKPNTQLWFINGMPMKKEGEEAGPNKNTFPKPSIVHFFDGIRNYTGIDFSSEIKPLTKYVFVPSKEFKKEEEEAAKKENER